MTTATDSYRSTTTLSEIAERLRHADRIIVVTHSRPDGDAIGSCLAVHRGLGSVGVGCEIWLMGQVDDALASLAGSTPLNLVDETTGAMPDDDADAVLIVDTGAWAQLEPIEHWLRRHREKVIGIDHHPRGDDVAASRFVDPSAGSTTLILLDLLEQIGVEISGGPESVAEALFLGLATDTGWFKYDNADERVFSAAAQLLRAGVDKSRLYQTTDEWYEPRRLDLEARALASLEYLDGGRIALMTLTKNDFAETGGSMLDLTGMVNMPMSVRAVRATILLSEGDDGVVKLSLRSKPAALPGDHFIDVNELAQRFGGGGHVHAAGARIRGSIADAKSQIFALFGG